MLTLASIKAFIKSHKKQLIFLSILLTFSSIIFLIFYIKHDEVISFAEWLKNDYLPTHPYTSRLLIVLILIITSFPPLIGYGITLTISGWLFGLWGGFLINFIGALLGATLCLVVTRYLSAFISRLINRWNGRQKQRISFTELASPDEADSIALRTSSQDELSPIRTEDVIATTDDDQSLIMTPKPPEQQHNLLVSLTKYLHKHPDETLKMVTLLRLAPYPYTLLNITLAHIDSIPVGKYILGTVISLIKTILHAFVGSQLDDIAQIIKGKKPENGNDAARIAEYVVFGVAFIFSIIGGYYIYYMVQRALIEVNVPQEEQVEIEGEENSQRTQSPVQIEKLIFQKAD